MYAGETNYAVQYTDNQSHTCDNLRLTRRCLMCQNHSRYSQSGQALAEGSRHLKKLHKYTHK